ncbi:TonB-dependent receptor plug domain-containing protein [Tunicatimonas pelagia]|uniref:TonB-dependent receptor plug domain-containing protein n=1 Tax=Tunicatimonas pelagia TaxID=931531 RepID=UPI00266658EB|nr:TonB-dependent receptor [Tunicatimonas pelagia]WKN43092.1 TonB-dependent receptor [Tunicatimonas pelagia]
MKSKVLFFVGLLCIWQSAYSQDEEALFEMSLEDLMNVEIVSASKESESLFDAPVSSYSITREEIEKSGVTSIPEALRLCPGVIVRETTNGNYDIHLRGFDNPTRNSIDGTQVNQQTLLMVDNRPIFNYAYGAIIWGALPVDLIDVERIEIVRGPSAPLFGPNATTGVINIITRRPESTGWYARANAQYGDPTTAIGNVAVGKKFNEKTNVILSGNYQYRERDDNLYYVYGRSQYDSEVLVESVYLEGADLLPNAEVTYPRPELAIDKLGINAFINHQFNENISVDISLGMHESEVQKNFLNPRTSIGFSGNSSRYINIASQIYGLSAKISYTRGYDQFDYDDTPDIVLEYDAELVDVVVDYQWKIGDKLQLRPSLNYQSATYDDSNYRDKGLFGGFFNGEATVSGVAASLRADYNFTDNWRIIGSVRADKFSRPDDVYVSYQFATTYNLNDKFLFRAAYSKSNSSAFAINTSADIDVTFEVSQFPGIPIRRRYSGDTDLVLPSIRMAEIGFRAKISDRFRIDLDIFQQQLQDVNTFVLDDLVLTPTGLAERPFINTYGGLSLKTVPAEFMQRGVTFSANYVASTKFQFKPFITIQRTQAEDLPLDYNALPLNPTPTAENPLVNLNTIDNGIDTELLSTPRVYGGFFAHGSFTSRLQANLSGYYFDSHTLYMAQDDLDEAVQIDSKLLLNSKISYRVVDPLKVYINVRNLLGNDSREYYRTDRIGRMILIGASFSL